MLPGDRPGRPWWLPVLAIIAGAILFIELAGVVGGNVIVHFAGWWKGPGAFDSSIAGTLPGRFARWDARYYLRIAESGYSRNGNERVFFPLYPLTMRLVGQVAGLSLLWSGTLTSIVCFILAGLLAYRWVLLDYDSSTALWTVAWLCFMPVSFFFVAIYTESLFLLLSIAALYLARRGYFLAGGAVIGMATAARPIGILLIVPYVVELVQQRDASRGRLVSSLAGLALAPAGLAAYLLYLGRGHGLLAGFGQYTAVQSGVWQRHFSLPWVSVADGLRTAALDAGLEQSSLTQHMAAWQDLAYVVVGLLLSVWAVRRLRPSAAAYLVAGIIFLLSSPAGTGSPLMSAPRHIAGLAPLYVALADLSLRLPVRWRRLALGLSAVQLAALAAWFSSGRWVA